MPGAMLSRPGKPGRKGEPTRPREHASPLAPDRFRGLTCFRGHEGSSVPHGEPGREVWSLLKELNYTATNIATGEVPQTADEFAIWIRQYLALPA